jgi:mannan endo-1,4-beta-mannosidase
VRSPLYCQLLSSPLTAATQATRRQSDSGLSGPAFDGTYGVDSEDIANIPDVGFGTFQLFPDQNQYVPPNPALSPYDNNVQEGIAWIQQNAQTGKEVGKPMILVSFGLVTQNNLPNYVPFDSDTPVAAPTSTGLPAPTGVTDDQRDAAYGQWLSSKAIYADAANFLLTISISAGISSGLQGMVQYQVRSQPLDLLGV